MCCILSGGRLQAFFLPPSPPPPPHQLSSSLLPPSPPHPTSLCAHRRVCIFISRLSHTDTTTNLKRRESKSCIITASVCALHCISTVCTLTDVRRRDCGTLFFYFLFKLFKVFSEKISVWYCETEETTECVLNRYHTRPKLAVPSVQQLIQCMRESVIPAKTFPVRVFGVFL